MDPSFRDLGKGPPTMDERLKNAAIRGDVGFLREAIASGKPSEYFKLEYVPRDGTDAKEVGGNMFYLAAINGRVEFIREALEVLPFSVVHELLKHWRDLRATPYRSVRGNTFRKALVLQRNEYEQSVRPIEDFYEKHNSMDRDLKNAAIQGGVEFLKQASDKPLEYFKSMYFRCPTRKENGGNIFHLAAHHSKVEFFKAAMEILLHISEVELDILLWQRGDDIYRCEEATVLDVAGRKCREIVQVMEEFYRGRNSMDEQLKKAAIEGDVEFLREAVAPSVNKPNAYFQSLYCVPDPNYGKDQVGNMFHLAAWNKRGQFLREAMEILPKAAGVDVYLLLCQQDHPKHKRNPLHVAASEGYNKIVKVILDYYDDHKSLIPAPAMDCPSSVKPWLVKDEQGYTPFYYVMDRCREECALKLLSIDSELFSHMDDCGKDDPYYSIFVIALRRGFSKVILKFWESAPHWYTFDKRVLACALGPAPNCSDEIFILVLEQNLRVIKDRDFYRIWSPLASWVSIGKLYPFECVLKEEACATDLRRYIVDMISEENPLYYVAQSDCDEDRGVQIATILVDAWEKERGQLNAVKFDELSWFARRRNRGTVLRTAVKFDELPWFARRRNGGTVLRTAIVKRREKVALHFLSLEKIELFLGEEDQSLFLAINHQCSDVAQKILDLVDQHGLKALLTTNVGRTVLHNAPKCNGTWMEIGELWPFQCVLNKHEFNLNVRKNFGTLLGHKTDDKSWNPLHVAAAVGANGVIEHIVRFVLEAIPGQNLRFYCSAIEGKDIEGNTPVDFALSTGREELALYFLSMGIPSACDYIFKAIDKQCHSVVKFLLGKIHEGGWAHHLHMGRQNLLHIASKCTEENAKLIVERWPELINEQDERGKTPLERASEAGTSWLLKLILQKEQSSILKAPATAWVEPCERGDLSTILAFVENTYFRYVCRKQKDTPLHHVRFKDYNKYQQLLKCELIRELKNARDNQGNTPLHKAINNRNKDLTEILFSMGDIEWNIKNKDGKTAMDLLQEASQDPEWVSGEGWKQIGDLVGIGVRVNLEILWVRDEQAEFCNAIGVNPSLKITYIPSRRDVTQMRETISLVAALLATITFTAGFTLPGGFNGDNGEAILAKKAAFLVFLIADTYAMCCSMLILFSIIWSMVYDSKRSSFLADRSLGLLKHSLYGTFLAFMTGVYTVTGKQRPIASNNQGQDEETAPLTTQGEHQEIMMRSQQLLMINQSEHPEAEPLGEQSESKLDSIV
ncbi:hypothetical protein Cgig2_028925 [Carnegiea gigantea]|uniref:PGG domain-containing protein n=1 Tax=Carnegiea gigantea TaxID=171969 RepID=A0A9Q1QN95_9CARY|nr:hypothetical protein Cgig2_028925 [Carnegiea gigantea]